MTRRRKGNPVHGWVVLDKPLGLTSTQGVGRVRRLFDAQKAGHAGTLDPLATGILPIALGEATKTVPFMMDAAKSYAFTITWGANTDTLDSEGQVTATSDYRPTRPEIEAVLPEFIGRIEQLPPKYSAIKVDGQRAYDLARRGEDVTLKTRPVQIDRLSLGDQTPDRASFVVDCGKGTYVRSLARDIAERLGACGHVTALRRTRVGPFTLDGSFSLDAIEKLCHRGRVLEGLLPLQAALDDIPVLQLSETEAEDLKHGRAISRSDQNLPRPAIHEDNWVLAMRNEQAVALCDAQGNILYPKRVFNL